MNVGTTEKTLPSHVGIGRLEIWMCLLLTINIIRLYVGVWISVLSGDRK